MRWFVRLSRSFGKCPPGWKLTRAVSRGLDADIGWHLSSCTRCSAHYRELRQTADALGALPDRRMSEEVKDAVGRRLMESALSPSALVPHPRPVRQFVIATAALVAVVALAGVWAVRRGTAAGRAPAAARPWLGAVRAIGSARFTRVRSRPDEIVRLDDGTVDFEVTRLSGQERFRVVTGDAEVEVRGTEFEVTAAHGRLAYVRVWRGRVEVRPGGGGVSVLDAGDEWMDGSRLSARPVRPASAAPVASAAPPASPNLPPVPPRHNPIRVAHAAVPRPHSAARGPSFDDAWSLLRAGKAAPAAAAFDEIAGSAGDAGAVEDARYWRAVALARAGQTRASQAALVLFLSDFPRSSRAGEASVILGWSLFRAGELDRARIAFTRGTADPAERVRLGAREGLTQVDAAIRGRARAAR
jgi:TolA-binding protein